MRCEACPIKHVPNAVFCEECGAYLLEGKELGTQPFDLSRIKWLGRVDEAGAKPRNLSESGPLSLRLLIGRNSGTRQVQVPFARPIRLGRNDPAQAIFPEVDLTEDRGREHGVSREHVCIFRQGNTVKVEDLASTNGTLLNGRRLAPYLPETLNDGDQLQVGKLLVEVSFQSTDT
jgi:pSer/pThr/pTyr-binding forkhead associated (FHA) protein